MGRQQNRNDAIILFNMSNARYVRIVGTARNTNYGYSIWNMAIYGTEDLKVDETTMPEQTTQRPTSPEVTTTPVATKSDMITNQAAMEPVSTSEQTTAKHSIKVAKTKVKKVAKDKKKLYVNARAYIYQKEVLWFMAQDKETKHGVAQTVFVDDRKELR